MVLARRLVAGVLLASVASAVGVARSRPRRLPRAPAPASSASTLYQDALATTRSWSVHYASPRPSPSETLVESGDAGPASGSQTVLMGKGSISILVIGGITYVKGNAGGLESLAGLSASQAAEAAGQWIEFSTDNAAFAPVVAGVRSQDVAKELALKGPLSLGHARTLDGQAVDAIDGTQTFGRKTLHVVLYVRAQGTHVPVEEDSVNAKGQHTAAEHVIYSNWGEQVRPEAPMATISIGSHQRRLREPAAARRRRGPRTWEDVVVAHLAELGARRAAGPGLQESEGHAPLAPSPVRTAAAAAGLTAAAALALAAAAAPAAGAAHDPSTNATAEYQAALKAVGTQGVHFVSTAKQNGRHARRDRRRRHHLGRPDAGREEREASRST